MIDHRSALELAATAIDFDLDADERRQLDSHLAGCNACRAEALALRGDAALLAALPSIEPPTWVRRVIGRRHGPQRGVLLIAAALLLAASVGVAVAVGAVLRDRIVPTPLPSAPPITTPSLDRPTPAASVELKPSPSAAPSTSAAAGPLPIPKATSFPSGAGSAWIGAGPSGGTWVLTVNDGGTDPTSVSVIGLLDASGRPRTGWPIALTGWRCGEDGPPRRLPVADDGSIRLVCAEVAQLDGPLRHVGFAFDPAGHALPGWPVELPNVGLTTSAVVVGDELRLVSSEIASTEGQTAPEQAAAWWLIAVSATGDVQSGRRYEVPDAAGSFDVRLAPNGIAYRLSFSSISAAIRTEITAFDLDGVRPGWPVTVDGIASQPSVRPDGGLVVVRTKPALLSQVLFIAPTGGNAITASADLPVEPIDDRTGAGAVLLSPIVGPDGGAWVVGTFGSTKPAIARVSPGGAVTGPYMPTGMPLQRQGVCDAQDTGCGVWRATPAVDANGTLFIPTSAVGDGGGLTSSSGGSLVAIGRDGSPATGWPVFLLDSMAGYWAVLPRADGTVSALAVVPTPDGGNEWSLVLLGADGRSRATTVLIEP